MSRWTHPVCERCWGALYGERIPTRMVIATAETCCRCKLPTRSGIYVRHDPEQLACLGVHKADA